MSWAVTRSARPPDAALEHELNVERVADRPDVGAAAFERGGRRHRGHADTGDAGERVAQLLGDPVAEVFDLRVARHVHERKYGDRVVVRICRRGGIGQHPPDAEP